jgi:hypothetical protein
VEFGLLFCLILMQFCLPYLLRSLFRFGALRSSNLQVGLLLLFESLLAVAVFLAFISAWVAGLVCYKYVGPWMLGTSFDAGFWDLPLTARRLGAILLLIVPPLVIFSRVGLISLRDVHQVCKEQRDRVAKRHDLARIWKGL